MSRWGSAYARIRLAADLSRLGFSARDRLKICGVTLAMPIKGRIAPLRNRWWEVRIGSGGRPHALVVGQQADLLVLHDVFVLMTYAVDLDESPRAVIDLGAHIGLATLFFRSRYPDAHILAVEPDPSSYAMLARNVGGLSNVKILNVAAGAENGTATLFKQDSTWASSLHRAEGPRGAVEIETRSLDTMLGDLAEPRVDLLKIDIEGAERAVLTNSSLLGSRVGMVVGEFHKLLVPEDANTFLDRFPAFEGRVVHQDDEHVFFRLVRRQFSDG